MSHVRLSALLLLAGLSASCTQIQEPAPICNMGAIANQRQLVAFPANLPGDPSPLLEMPLNSVSIIDHTVIDKLFIRSVSAQRTPAGTVRVNSQIINCTDYPLALEARTQFIAEDRASPAEPVSAWKRLYLQARSSEFYSESSISRDSARHYLIEVRENR